MKIWLVLFALQLLLAVGLAGVNVHLNGIRRHISYHRSRDFRPELIIDPPDDSITRYGFLLDGQRLDNGTLATALPGYHILIAATSSPTELHLQTFPFVVSETPVLWASTVHRAAFKSSGIWGSGVEFRRFSPSRFPSDVDFPCVWRVKDGLSRTLPNANVEIKGERLYKRVALHRGAGSVVLPPGQSFSARSDTGQHMLVSPSFFPPELCVAIPEAVGFKDMQIAADNCAIILHNFTVRADQRLRIGEGVVVRMGPGANMIILGKLEAFGTEKNPISFVPHQRGRRWGGFIVHGELVTQHTIAYGACSDHSGKHAFGSFSPQSMVRVLPGGSFQTRFSAWLDGSGPFLGAEKTNLRLTSVVVQNFRAGVQVAESDAVFDFVHLLQFSHLGLPLHLHGENSDGMVLVSGRVVVWNCVVADVEGVGIKTIGPGLQLEVERTVVERAAETGISISNLASFWESQLSKPAFGMTVSVRNSWVHRCGQGIQSGFGDLQTASHATNCTVSDCRVGIRYGDDRPWPSMATFYVSNSAILGASIPVWNMHAFTFLPQRDCDVYGPLDLSPSRCIRTNSWRTAHFQVHDSLVDSMLSGHPKNTFATPREGQLTVDDSGQPLLISSGSRFPLSYGVGTGVKLRAKPIVAVERGMLASGPWEARRELMQLLSIYANTKVSGIGSPRHDGSNETHTLLTFTEMNAVFERPQESVNAVDISLSSKHCLSFRMLVELLFGAELEILLNCGYPSTD